MIKNEEEIFGNIYILTNEINGKQYIGQTIGSVSVRWSQHKCDAKRKTNAIALAITKYGHENFKVETLECNIKYVELDNKEIEYIKKYNTISPNGYNISHGGQTFLTEEERKEMSERVSGENNPMFGAYGELNPFYGKKHSDETKAKLTESSKRMWDNMSYEDKENEKDRLREMNRLYYENNYSGMKGKSHSKETKTRISNTLKNREFSEEHKKKISENSSRKRGVCMLDKNTNNEIMCFESMTIASDWINKNTTYANSKPSAISNVCIGKNKTVYGYKWVYCDLIGERL